MSLNRPVDARDRYRGALLGLAVGDALGAAVEFKSQGTFEPVTGMRGGGPHPIEPGDWTDDTSMALCLAESLVECGGFDPADQMRRYIRWWRDGHFSSIGWCFDIGITTSSALARFESSEEPYSGSTEPRAAGNGSLMRLAPVPLAFSADLAAVEAHSAGSSRTTHGAPQAVDACRFFGVVLASAVRGTPKDALLSRDEFTGELVPEVEAVATGSYRERRSSEIRGTGYVVDSLEAALWAFASTDSFADAVLAAVNLGDDSDTTGAVCGQIAGAFYGADAIPSDWLEQLTMREEIAALADRLLELAQR